MNERKQIKKVSSRMHIEDDSTRTLVSGENKRIDFERLGAILERIEDHQREALRKARIEIEVSQMNFTVRVCERCGKRIRKVNQSGLCQSCNGKVQGKRGK